jgi:hypothetical protein
MSVCLMFKDVLCLVNYYTAVELFHNLRLFVRLQIKVLLT